MKNIIESIKKHEGFEPKPYIDVLVKRNPEEYGITRDEMDTIERHLAKLKLTFGYGFTWIDEDESEIVLEMKLKKKIKELEKREPFVNKLPLEKQEILAEMVYQMGVSGVLKFKNMWKALKEFDYHRASLEMLDSNWYVQTPTRARELSDRMRHI